MFHGEMIRIRIVLRCIKVVTTLQSNVWKQTRVQSPHAFLSTTKFLFLSHIVSDHLKK